MVAEKLMRQIVDIFVLVNPKSGSRLGQKLLDAELKRVEMEIEGSGSTEVIM